MISCKARGGYFSPQGLYLQNYPKIDYFVEVQLLYFLTEMCNLLYYCMKYCCLPIYAICFNSKRKMYFYIHLLNKKKSFVAVILDCSQAYSLQSPL